MLEKVNEVDILTLAQSSVARSSAVVGCRSTEADMYTVFFESRRANGCCPPLAFRGCCWNLATVLLKPS